MQRRSFLATSAALAVGLLTPRKGYAGVMVGTNANISGQDPLNQIAIDGECTIAVDPTSGRPPRRLFAAAHWGGNNQAGWYSMDGGQTWNNSFTGLTNCGGDGYAKFDDSGVLYLVYISSSSDPYYCKLAVSTDYGQTFGTPYTVASMHSDQPSVAIGPDNATRTLGARAVWITAEAIGDGSCPVFLWGAKSSNLNSFTAFQVPGSPNGNFGGIAVGPYGEVVAAYIQPDNTLGPVTIYAARLLTGLSNHNAIPEVYCIAHSNVGGGMDGHGVLLPAQPRRGIENKVQLAWWRGTGTQGRGRLYAVYINCPVIPVDPNNMSVWIAYSDDAGANWTNPPICVSDTGVGSKFNPAIAVDQSTGYVCVTWYDSRQSPDNTTAQIYGAMSIDGGNTWSSNFPVATQRSNGGAAPLLGGTDPFDFGDFDTMDGANGYFWCAWADNSLPDDLIPPNTRPNRRFCLGAAYITLV